MESRGLGRGRVGRVNGTPCLDRTCTVPVSLITGHSAFASSHTFYGGAWISVGTTSRLCWQRGKVEEDGEKKNKVREGVVKGDTEVEVCGQRCRARAWPLFVHSLRE